MANIIDVAACVVQKHTNLFPELALSTVKLHRLLYYCQVWHLVWHNRPAFSDRIEAWASGAIVPTLWEIHEAGFFSVTLDKPWLGNSKNIDSDLNDTVEKVIAFYAGHNGQWLNDLIMMETPWKLARTGLSPGERGHQEITQASMKAYYESLHPTDKKQKTINRIFLVLRYFTIVSFIAWSAAAAALQMWGPFCFFVFYTIVLFVLGKMSDKNEQ